MEFDWLAVSNGFSLRSTNQCFLYPNHTQDFVIFIWLLKLYLATGHSHDGPIT